MCAHARTHRARGGSGWTDLLCLLLTQPDRGQPRVCPATASSAGGSWRRSPLPVESEVCFCVPRSMNLTGLDSLPPARVYFFPKDYLLRHYTKPSKNFATSSVTLVTTVSIGVLGTVRASGHGHPAWLTGKGVRHCGSGVSGSGGPRSFPLSWVASCVFGPI